MSARSKSLTDGQRSLFDDEVYRDPVKELERQWDAEPKAKLTRKPNPVSLKPLSFPEQQLESDDAFEYESEFRDDLDLQIEESLRPERVLANHLAIEMDRAKKDVEVAREVIQRFEEDTENCLRCGRKLKDATSKFRGIGPECWRWIIHQIWALEQAGEEFVFSPIVREEVDSFTAMIAAREFPDVAIEHQTLGPNLLHEMPATFLAKGAKGWYSMPVRKWMVEPLGSASNIYGVDPRCAKGLGWWTRSSKFTFVSMANEGIDELLEKPKIYQGNP